MLIICKGYCDLVYTKREKPMTFEAKRSHVDRKLQPFKSSKVVSEAGSSRRDLQDHGPFKRQPLQFRYESSYIPTVKEQFDQQYFEAAETRESEETADSQFVFRRVATGEPIGMRSLLNPSLGLNLVQRKPYPACADERRPC